MCSVLFTIPQDPLPPHRPGLFPFFPGCTACLFYTRPACLLLILLLLLMLLPLLDDSITMRRRCTPPFGIRSYLPSPSAARLVLTLLFQQFSRANSSFSFVFFFFWLHSPVRLFVSTSPTLHVDRAFCFQTARLRRRRAAQPLLHPYRRSTYLSSHLSFSLSRSTPRIVPGLLPAFVSVYVRRGLSDCLSEDVPPRRELAPVPT